jgi:hypothetical protein
MTLLDRLGSGDGSKQYYLNNSTRKWIMHANTIQNISGDNVTIKASGLDASGGGPSKIRFDASLIQMSSHFTLQNDLMTLQKSSFAADMQTDNSSVKIPITYNNFSFADVNGMVTDKTVLGDTWIDLSGKNYKVEFTPRSARSKIYIKLKINYVSSNESEQLISFALWRYIEGSANELVYEDMSMGTLMGVANNSVYCADYIDSPDTSNNIHYYLKYKIGDGGDGIDISSGVLGYDSSNINFFMAQELYVPPTDVGATSEESPQTNLQDVLLQQNSAHFENLTVNGNTNFGNTLTGAELNVTGGINSTILKTIIGNDISNNQRSSGFFNRLETDSIVSAGTASQRKTTIYGPVDLSSGSYRGISKPTHLSIAGNNFDTYFNIIDNGSETFKITNTGNTTVGGTLAVSNDTTLTGALYANGGIICDSDKFIVANGTGNTTIAGTLAVAGAFSANGGINCDSNKFVVADSTGNTTIAGTLAVAGAFSANGGITCDSNKFVVADSTGNTTIAGTLAVNNSTTLTGALYANGGITCDSNKFVVADSTGNTSIAGTLAVNNSTTLTGALYANGGITCDSNKFVVADSTGNTSIAGTLAVNNSTTLTGALYANGGITCDSNKFVVADSTGNTSINGTLAVNNSTTLTGTLYANGGITCDSNKFVVEDTTGNTTIAGNLTTDKLKFTPENGATLSSNTISITMSSTNMLLCKNLTTTNNITGFNVNPSNWPNGGQAVISVNNSSSSAIQVTSTQSSNYCIGWTEDIEIPAYGYAVFSMIYIVNKIFITCNTYT